MHKTTYWKTVSQCTKEKWAVCVVLLRLDLPFNYWMASTHSFLFLPLSIIQFLPPSFCLSPTSYLLMLSSFPPLFCFYSLITPQLPYRVSISDHPVSSSQPMGHLRQSRVTIAEAWNYLCNPCRLLKDARLLKDLMQILVVKWGNMRCRRYTAISTCV